MWIGWNRVSCSCLGVNGALKGEQALTATLTLSFISTQLTPFGHDGQLWVSSGQRKSLDLMVPTLCMALKIQTEKKRVASWTADFLLPHVASC